MSEDQAAPPPPPPPPPARPDKDLIGLIEKGADRDGTEIRESE